jgi:hypothetical protein
MMIDEHYFSQFRQAEEERLVQRLERLRIVRERDEAVGAPVQPAWTWTMSRFVSRLLSGLHERRHPSRRGPHGETGRLFGAGERATGAHP